MRDYAENPRLLEERKAAVERRGAALGRMGEDIKAEKNITPDVLRLLSREDLENIKAKGDAAFIYYNQPVSQDGSVRSTGDNRTGSGPGDDEHGGGAAAAYSGGIDAGGLHRRRRAARHRRDDD